MTFRASKRLLDYFCCFAVISYLTPCQGQLIRQPNTSLNLPASLPSATGYGTENALGNLTFNTPIDVASAPGETNRLFVVERRGRIQCVTNLNLIDDGNSSTNPVKTEYLNLSNFLAGNQALTSSSECGLLSLAFHPNFNTVGATGYGTFFVFYSLNITQSSVTTLYQRVARFTVSNPAANSHTTSTATQTPLITQLDEAGNHNGGDLAFGADGYLYISVGDEGPQYDGADNGRRIAKDFFGAILRIDVDSKTTSRNPNPHNESFTPTVAPDNSINANTYKVPPDNPFVAMAEANGGVGNATYNGYTFPRNTIRTEIYSIGYRNPWRMSFDPQTGRLFVADVGQDNYEEVTIVTNGTNAGWSWREGLHLHNPAGSNDNDPAGFNPTPPIFEYDHTNDTSGPNEPDNDPIIYGSSITGGVVYRGNRLTELFGDYLLSDYNTGFLIALRENTNGTWTARRLLTDNNLSGFGYEPLNGDTIFCDLAQGIVKRLARSGITGTAPPALLSQTGAFTSPVSNLTPQTGLVAYTPNSPFWSDYASKSRWFALMNMTDKIGFSEDGNWSFPTGMVWVKHFDIKTNRNDPEPATRRKLETRFIVKTTDGIYGLSYKWRADQSDADLVTEAGESSAIANVTPAQNWRFPSRTECLVCHTPVGGYALSFNTPQLNRLNTFNSQRLNQIAALRDAVSTAAAPASYFSSGTVPSLSHPLPAFAHVSDTTQSLEWRVRSYLAVNCIQCHQPGGAATGYWDARHTLGTDMANLISAPLVNDGGDAANRFLVPGDAAHSMLLKRQQGNGVNRMPPLGTMERDLAAEQLVTDWINALPARQSFTQWQTSFFNSTTSSNALLNADPDLDGRLNCLEYLTGTNPNSAASAWSYGTMTVSGGNVQFQFTHPANRAAVVEVSNDMLNWRPWDVSGNTPTYPATAQPRVISVPSNSPEKFFRVKFKEP
jgi:glucose/arabinose dehydrogenase/mono/diheme cytochrome c family protein